MAAWFDQELAARALREVLEALEPHGIEILPVKGVLLARTIYADVSERPTSDVDLRVRPSDLRRVGQLCRGRGWEIQHGSKQWGTFETEVERSLVEFETSVGPPGVCAITVEEMLSRASRTTGRLGFEHLEPELHDHALVVCVSVFKDKIRNTVPWALSDLVRIAKQPGFDPAHMAALASRAQLRAATWIIADWAASAGPSDGWREVRDRIGPRPPRALYSRAYRKLAAKPESSPVLLSVLARTASDDAVMRARALALGGAGVVFWWSAQMLAR